MTLMTVRHRRANRQYVAMTDEEVWSFLDSKDRVFVAFPGDDGYPHVTPMWFCLLNGRIYLRTHDYKVKVRLAAAGKACCSIDDGKKYTELRGVSIWGRSRVVTDHPTVRRIAEAMDARYASVQWKETEMPRSWVTERKRERRAYIEIVPERISSWDNRKV
ncbi:MAG TPA: pyridoxamine 5'-phosphate oxidase family protein [Nitrososphaerales archaeon]|nr:pyridoxamine 5'-phosphate oxidase family protein [Nitrososphaerales archaeon]